jgi:hypothetical protein
VHPLRTSVAAVGIAVPSTEPAEAAAAWRALDVLGGVALLDTLPVAPPPCALFVSFIDASWLRRPCMVRFCESAVVEAAVAKAATTPTALVHRHGTGAWFGAAADDAIQCDVLLLPVCA